MLSESCRTVIADRLAQFPTFCAVVRKEDDPSVVKWIEFWAPKSTGDIEWDYVAGELYGEEAIQYVRNHDKPEFLTCVLLSIGMVLHFESRCAGLLERGFIDRVLKDFPDAVDRVFMLVHQHHPEVLN